MKNQSKRTGKRLLSGGVTVILMLALCLCLFAFFQTVNNGYVSFFGYSLFRVTTGSMEPTMFVGDLILTEDVPIEDVEQRDIISFFSKEAYLAGRTVTHRVVAKETTAAGRVVLTTRGDANSSADVHRVDEENYIGRVVWISGEGNVFALAVSFLSSGSGFFTCIAIPAIVICAMIFKRSMAVILADVKRLKEEYEARQNEGDPSATASKDKGAEASLTSEEYEAMRERIRAQLIKEQEVSNDGEQSKTE